MDQAKIGSFIKELRKEKELTQEQLAEALNTSRRTVSRWETGYNMPDLDVLLELSDYFQVDLREIFEGERKQTNMSELEETVMMAAEYTNDEKKRVAKGAFGFFVFGLIALVIHEALLFMELPETFWVGFAKGATAGLPFCAMVIGILYTTGYLTKISEAKKRIYSKVQKG